MRGLLLQLLHQRDLAVQRGIDLVFHGPGGGGAYGGSGATLGRDRERAREAEDPAPAPAPPQPPPPPPPPFRGPAADSALGERFVDVLPLVAARGYAAEASQALWLCGETWRAGDLGATNDMIVSSLRLQCGAVTAREAVRESFTFVGPYGDLQTLEGSTQLIRASILNNLPRVLQLIQLGAPLDVVDQSDFHLSALLWASFLGHEHVVAALLEGKYKGADVDQVCGAWTALETASEWGHVGVVRVLLARGAKQVRPGETDTAMFWAVIRSHIEVVKLLLAAPGASDALKTKHDGSTPLKWAIDFGHAEIVALLRAAGAPE
jgi:ankyrin repeat protein